MSNNKGPEDLRQALINAIGEMPIELRQFETIADASEGPVINDESLKKISHVLQSECKQIYDNDDSVSYGFDIPDNHIVLTHIKSEQEDVPGQGAVSVSQKGFLETRNIYEVRANSLRGISRIEVPKTIDPDSMRFVLNSGQFDAILTIHRKGLARLEAGKGVRF